MRWTDLDVPATAPPRVLIELYRRSSQQGKEDPDFLISLGIALRQVWDMAGAVEAFQRAEALDPEGFHAFGELADSLYMLELDDDALTVINRGHQKGFSNWNMEYIRASALRRLKKHPQAKEALRNAVAMSTYAFAAAEDLLAYAAETQDGDVLLDACDALPSTYKTSAPNIAYRAAAYSLLGRRDDACALIDLDRQVVQVAFEPSRTFESLRAFNAILMDEIAANAVAYREFPGNVPPDPAALRNNQLNVVAAKAYPALAAWLRVIIQKELERYRADTSSHMFVYAPEAGYLYTRGYIHRHAEHNGLHMHSNAVLSGVYHVRVPDEAFNPNEHLGVLQLGLLPPALKNFVPCWRQHAIQPVPGIVTLFPSFVFHDFAPTRSEQPRVALGIDLRAAVPE